MKNAEVENLQKQPKEVELQFESRVNQVMLSTQKKNQNQSSLKSEVPMQCKAEVMKELDKVLPAAVEQGLRDLPFEMVCAFREKTDEANSVVSYDKITVEFNNSDRPGGADGSMNIVTGVFTAVTSGYYIVTFSGWVRVNAGGETVMYLYHNGAKMVESYFKMDMQVGSGVEYVKDQGSRTVVSAACLYLLLFFSLRFNSIKIYSFSNIISIKSDISQIK